MSTKHRKLSFLVFTTVLLTFCYVVQGQADGRSIFHKDFNKIVFQCWFRLDVNRIYDRCLVNGTAFPGSVCRMDTCKFGERRYDVIYAINLADPPLCSEPLRCCVGTYILK